MAAVLHLVSLVFGLPIIITEAKVKKEGFMKKYYYSYGSTYTYLWRE